jgi:hypothetical protein
VKKNILGHDRVSYHIITQYGIVVNYAQRWTKQIRLGKENVRTSLGDEDLMSGVDEPNHTGLKRNIRSQWQSESVY